MSAQERFYEQRASTSTSVDATLTPIFIGMARKLLSYTTTDGSNSVSSLIDDTGAKFNPDLTSGSLIYWKQTGSYRVSAIDILRSTIFTTTDYQYENIETTQRQYTCFCVDSNTNTIVFTASLSQASFNVTGTTKNVVSFTLNETIPANIDLTQSNYEIYIGYVTTITLDNTYFSEANDILTCNISNLHSFSAVNLNAIISLTSNLYFDIIDYRYSTINLNDTISDEYVSNINNPLGLALARHQSISTTSATLMTIPSETADNVMTALANLNDNTLGYYITPLFMNADLGQKLISLANGLEVDYTWVENFLSYPLLFQAPESNGDSTIQPGYGHGAYGLAPFGE